MKLRFLLGLSALLLFAEMMLLLPAGQVGAAGNSVTVVGLYSETSAGQVSYRNATGGWTIVKLGDQIPDTAEIRVNVDRDWVEFIPTGLQNSVYQIAGDPKGAVITKKVSDILKEKPKTVSFPAATGKDNPKFANKVVVKQYLGRQVYKKNKDADRQDIKYGDVLESTGSVTIIAINNTIVLVLPNGKETKVVGPVKFNIAQVLKGGGDLYKYMNVTK